jgi:hypothetical protein
MLEPTDRTSFPPGLRTLSVGPRQQTRGSSPRALQERGRSYRGFTVRLDQRVWFIFQPASAMFQPASVTRALLAISAVGATQEV